MGVKHNPATKRLFIPLLTGLLSAVAILLVYPSGDTAAASPGLFAEYRGKIALDPGHGGKDPGSSGPKGVLEKDVCLALARRLALEMEPEYQIVLTRSDDYNVSLSDRTALANTQKADLFVSIHAAAGFLHATTGMTIFVFEPLKNKGVKGLAQPPSATSADAWDLAQLPHAAAAARMAETLQRALAAVPGAPEVRVVQAPLAVLKGAQMPAVLIEIGQLTNPATEERLAGETGRAAYARAIARGIDDYLAATRANPPPR